MQVDGDHFHTLKSGDHPSIPSFLLGTFPRNWKSTLPLISIPLAQRCTLCASRVARPSFQIKEFGG